jgi:hypothetical protein
MSIVPIDTLQTDIDRYLPGPLVLTSIYAKKSHVE